MTTESMTTEEKTLLVVLTTALCWCRSRSAPRSAGRRDGHAGRRRRQACPVRALPRAAGPKIDGDQAGFLVTMGVVRAGVIGRAGRGL
jgi:hypothetical protein